MQIAIRLTPRFYLGEMFAETQFAVALPDQNQLVFLALKRFSRWSLATPSGVH